MRKRWRRVAKCACLFAFALGVPSWAANDADAQRPKVIFETDFTFDVDDVGALAVLHALADRGEVDILAVSYNEVQDNAAVAIHAVNAWYGRPAIPIGVFTGQLEDPDDDHSRYIDALAAWAADAGDVPVDSSIYVYRRALGAQPDRSVTIVSVGFLNNLHDLLRSDGELVAAKVKELVLMGGVRNDGFNFVRHNLAAQAEYVLRHWPTPVVVSQEGADVLTGVALRQAPAENPVREAYRLWWRGEVKDRSSWDQVAVLYGVRGLGEYFRAVTAGAGKLRSGFAWEMQPGWRSYLALRMGKRELEAVIEALMVAPPRRQVTP